MGKNLFAGLIVGLGSVAVIGGLAVTNPSQADYERYAVARLTEYLEQNVCSDLPGPLKATLESQCRQVLRANQAPVAVMIQQNTVAQNFGLFTLYRTTLMIPGLDFLPTYQVSTLGIVDHFITYQTRQL